ncbi:hypothetical protein D3C71_2231000 [compost metagenome]
MTAKVGMVLISAECGALSSKAARNSGFCSAGRIFCEMPPARKTPPRAMKISAMSPATRPR